ncbi:MAG TPA: 50S ribosomal protein L20 [Candidatus Gracilibacteria bacterium]
MVRVNGGPTARARHKKVLKETKGFRGKRNSVFKIAKQAQMKAGTNAYVGRKQKKRDFRRLWIVRISAALRNKGIRYSQMKNQWLHARMEIDRKMLSELAINYPAVFDKVVEVGQKAKKVA